MNFRNCFDMAYVHTVVVRLTSRKRIITTVSSWFVAKKRCISKEICRMHAHTCLNKTRFERVWRNGVKARPLSVDRPSTFLSKQIKRTRSVRYDAYISVAVVKLADIDVYVRRFYRRLSMDVPTPNRNANPYVYSFWNDETVWSNTGRSFPPFTRWLEKNHILHTLYSSVRFVWWPKQFYRTSGLHSNRSTLTVV